ncbi:MAG: hypothetical protein GXY51_12075 [Bacteroidetes bacterium]|jgi:hypothetical protein|nr:hypothetical protein [Bacteroidota bacterium]
MGKFIDLISLIVIAVTYIFFLLALFTKGITHYILPEAAVLLVSIKLIMIGHRATVHYIVIGKELKNIQLTLNKTS